MKIFCFGFAEMKTDTFENVSVDGAFEASLTHLTHYITAKKLPKSDTTAAGPAVGRQQRGVDLRETNESHQGGCCK